MNREHLPIVSKGLKKRRKHIAFICSSVVMLIIFIVSGIYVGISYKSDFVYAQNADGTLTITGYEGEGAELVIPKRIGFRKVTEIGKEAFAGNTVITNLSFSSDSNISIIGEGAFKSNKNLTTVVFPQSLITINAKAFSHCEKLKTVVFSSGLKSIGSEAFSDCASLKTISLPHAVNDLDDGAFSDCSLENVTVPINMLAYGDIKNNPIKNLVLMQSNDLIKSIPNGADIEQGFAYGIRESLETLTIGDGIAGVGNYAFAECTKLANISISDSVAVIGKYAFYGCSRISTFNFPLSVINLGSNAFQGCAMLESLKIPASLSNIGNDAFKDCTSLSNIMMLADMPPQLGSGVFANVSESFQINVPESAVTNYKTYWSAHESKISAYISEAMIIEAKGFDINVAEDAMSIILPNATAMFTFGDKITVSSGAKWNVFLDIKGKDEVPTKTIVPEVGDNFLYILVTAQNGVNTRFYTVNVYRNYMFTLLYDFDNNSANPAEIIIEEGSIIENNRFPTKQGYHLTGWLDGEKKWDFDNDRITRNNLTLKAEWTPNLNQIVFDKNGGEGSMSNQQITTDASASLTPNEYSKPGYHFGGWAESSDGEIKYPNGSDYTMGIQDSYTLYAVWNKNTNHIIFNANGGAGEMSNQLVQTDTTAALSLNTFTRTGYSFAGWAQGSSSEMVYSEGSNYTMGVAPEYTLYAVWTARNYTINFDSDNGGSTEAKQVTYDAPIGQLPQPSDGIYTFGGWYSAVGGGGIQYNEETVYTFTQDITVYAEWLGTSSLTYFIDDSNPSNTCAVTGGGEDHTSIAIPEYVRGKAVRSITANAFASCSNMTSITIPHSVEYIGNSAFSGCSGLTEISIPNSMTYIGESAFSGCTGLTEIVISNPNFGGIIGSSAFSGCSGLESMTLPFVGKNRSATGNEALFGYIFGETSFSGSTQTQQYYSSNSSATYYLPSSLRTVIIIRATVLRYGAFSNCSLLTEIVIPNSVTSIEGGAFSGCGGLERMTLPFVGKSSSASGSEALFGYIFGEESYSGGIRTTQMYMILFGTKNYYIPGNLSSLIVNGGSLKFGAFYNCNYLTSLTILNNVANIGSSVFSGCSRLTIYAEPASKPENWSGFSDRPVYWGITSANFLETENMQYVSSNGKAIIARYTGAHDDLTIPSSVTIGDSSVSVAEIGAYAFSYSSLESILIPAGITSIGYRAFYHCGSLGAITVDTGNQYHKSIDGNLYNKAGTTFIQYPPGKAGSSFVIPDKVTSIASSAFAYCSGLTSITISNSVTSIGEYAFYYCSGLTSITLPTYVTTIRAHAFHYCSGLTYIYLSSRVTTIESYAFAACSALPSITIPSSVRGIGAYAFYNCSDLYSVYMRPEEPPSLGASAFDLNASGRKIYIRDLMSLFFYNAHEDWKSYADSMMFSIS